MEENIDLKLIPFEKPYFYLDEIASKEFINFNQVLRTLTIFKFRKNKIGKWKNKKKTKNCVFFYLFNILIRQSNLKTSFSSLPKDKSKTDNKSF